MCRPRRIRVYRRKGFKLPEGAVYVGRPTKWGNPYRPGPGFSRKRMVEKYRSYLLRRPALVAALPELRGRDLACWCKLDEPCHADILLELANGPPPPIESRRIRPAPAPARRSARRTTRKAAE